MTHFIPALNTALIHVFEVVNIRRGPKNGAKHGGVNHFEGLCEC